MSIPTYDRNDYPPTQTSVGGPGHRYPDPPPQHQAPRPPPSQHTRRLVLIIAGAMAALVLLGTTAWALTANHGTAAAVAPKVSTSAPASPTAAPSTRVPAAAPTKTVTEQPRPTQTIYQPAPAPTTIYAPAPVYAGSGVYAGPNTSIPFALNVQQAAEAAGYPYQVSAWSPVTNQWYVMTQTGTNPYVYQGGNNALVAFAS